jgi:hypothetical protein
LPEQDEMQFKLLRSLILFEPMGHNEQLELHKLVPKLVSEPWRTKDTFGAKDTKVAMDLSPVMIGANASLTRICRTR